MDKASPHYAPVCWYVHATLRQLHSVKIWEGVFAYVSSAIKSTNNTCCSCIMGTHMCINYCSVQPSLPSLRLVLLLQENCPYAIHAVTEHLSLFVFFYNVCCKIQLTRFSQLAADMQFIVLVNLEKCTWVTPTYI